FAVTLLFPYTTLFRSVASEKGAEIKYSYSYRAEDFKSMLHTIPVILWVDGAAVLVILFIMSRKFHKSLLPISYGIQQLCEGTAVDRKSTRLNSSHVSI